MFTMTPSHGEWDGDCGIRAPYAMGPWLPWWCQKFLNQWIWGSTCQSDRDGLVGIGSDWYICSPGLVTSHPDAAESPCSCTSEKNWGVWNYSFMLFPLKGYTCFCFSTYTFFFNDWFMGTAYINFHNFCCIQPLKQPFFPPLFIHSLALRGLLKLRDFMGASGGATSALLALADPQESSRSWSTTAGELSKWWFLVILNDFKTF